MKGDLEFITLEIDELKEMLILMGMDAAARVTQKYEESRGKVIDTSGFMKRFDFDADLLISKKRRLLAMR